MVLDAETQINTTTPVSCMLKSQPKRRFRVGVRVRVRVRVRAVVHAAPARAGGSAELRALASFYAIQSRTLTGSTSRTKLAHTDAVVSLVEGRLRNSFNRWLTRLWLEQKIQNRRYETDAAEVLHNLQRDWLGETWGY